MTEPLEREHAATLTLLLEVASRLGFAVPAEAACHLHFDGAPFESAPALRALATLTHPRRSLLRAMARTNPRCRRLGPWSPAVFGTMLEPGFTSLTWPDAQALLAAAQPTKYCDFKIRNLIRPVAEKRTVEVRIAPMAFDVDTILALATLFEALLQAARRGTNEPWPESLAEVSGQAAYAFARQLGVGHALADWLAQRV